MLEWRVRAELSPEGKVTITPALLEGEVLIASPVDLMMAGIGACFVKSCHMVLEARGEAKVAVSCDVTGRKADNPPNRVGHVILAWSLPDLDAEHGAKIARDAKRICTVTNAMCCTFDLVAS